MNKNWDFTLQVLFVLGLVGLAAGFYVTRLAPLRADNPNNQPIEPYAQFDSAFQFEQEEQRIITQIKVLKADYASNLAVFLEEKAKLETSVTLSDLEKREKLTVLKQIYSNVFFQHKLDLIDEQNLKLNELLKRKCLKFCTYQDLPNGF